MLAVSAPGVRVVASRTTGPATIVSDGVSAASRQDCATNVLVCGVFEQPALDETATTAWPASMARSRSAAAAAGTNACSYTLAPHRPRSGRLRPRQRGQRRARKSGPSGSTSSTSMRMWPPGQQFRMLLAQQDQGVASLSAAPPAMLTRYSGASRRAAGRCEPGLQRPYHVAHAPAEGQGGEPCCRRPLAWQVPVAQVVRAELVEVGHHPGRVAFTAHGHQPPIRHELCAMAAIAPAAVAPLPAGFAQTIRMCPTRLPSLSSKANARWVTSITGSSRPSSATA